MITVCAGGTPGIPPSNTPILPASFCSKMGCQLGRHPSADLAEGPQDGEDPFGILDPFKGDGRDAAVEQAQQLRWMRRAQVEQAHDRLALSQPVDLVPAWGERP